jgi:hypothetical protein
MCPIAGGVAEDRLGKGSLRPVADAFTGLLFLSRSRGPALGDRFDTVLMASVGGSLYPHSVEGPSKIAHHLRMPAFV